MKFPRHLRTPSHSLPDRRHRDGLAGLGEVEDEHAVVVAFAVGARPSGEALRAVDIRVLRKRIHPPDLAADRRELRPRPPLATNLTV